MAQKILVTTDLSANSKAGIRFAIQLASQNKSTLVFYNVIELMKPTRWSEDQYDNYLKQELANAKAQLLKFVSAEYKHQGVKHAHIQCVVEHSNSVARAVVDYARKIKASFICMSTRGAGVIKKFLGTHSSDVLTHSPVPVFVVPKSYRKTKISSIMYSSDFDRLAVELRQVKKFTAPLKTKISVFYYDYLLEVKEIQQRLKKLAARFKEPGIKFNFRKLNIEHTLSTHLQKDIKRTKPSLVVLFTKQNRDWFERIFLSSKTAELSFDSKVPLLVFRKNG